MDPAKHIADKLPPDNLFTRSTTAGWLQALIAAAAREEDGDAAPAPPPPAAQPAPPAPPTPASSAQTAPADVDLDYYDQASDVEDDHGNDPVPGSCVFGGWNAWAGAPTGAARGAPAFVFPHPHDAGGVGGPGNAQGSTSGIGAGSSSNFFTAATAALLLSRTLNTVQGGNAAGAWQFPGGSSSAQPLHGTTGANDNTAGSSSGHGSSSSSQPLPGAMGISSGGAGNVFAAAGSSALIGTATRAPLRTRRGYGLFPGWRAGADGAWQLPGGSSTTRPVPGATGTSNSTAGCSSGQGGGSSQPMPNALGAIGSAVRSSSGQGGSSSQPMPGALAARAIGSSSGGGSGDQPLNTAGGNNSNDMANLIIGLVAAMCAAQGSDTSLEQAGPPPQPAVPGAQPAAPGATPPEPLPQQDEQQPTPPPNQDVEEEQQGAAGSKAPNPTLAAADEATSKDQAEG